MQYRISFIKFSHLSSTALTIDSPAQLPHGPARVPISFHKQDSALLLGSTITECIPLR